MGIQSLLDFKVIKSQLEPLYNIFSICCLSAMIVSSIFCITKSTYYTPVSIGLLTSILSLFSLTHQVFPVFSATYFLKYLPCLENYEGRAVLYVGLGISGFIREMGRIGTVTGISMILCGIFGVLVHHWTKEPEPERTHLKLPI